MWWGLGLCSRLWNAFHSNGLIQHLLNAHPRFISENELGGWERRFHLLLSMQMESKTKLISPGDQTHYILCDSVEMMRFNASLSVLLDDEMNNSFSWLQYFNQGNCPRALLCTMYPSLEKSWRKIARLWIRTKPVLTFIWMANDLSQMIRKLSCPCELSMAKSEDSLIGAHMKAPFHWACHHS